MDVADTVEVGEMRWKTTDTFVRVWLTGHAWPMNASTVPSFSHATDGDASSNSIRLGVPHWRSVSDAEDTEDPTVSGSTDLGRESALSFPQST